MFKSCRNRKKTHSHDKVAAWTRLKHHKVLCLWPKTHVLSLFIVVRFCESVANLPKSKKKQRFHDILLLITCAIWWEVANNCSQQSSSYLRYLMPSKNRRKFVIKCPHLDFGVKYLKMLSFISHNCFKFVERTMRLLNCTNYKWEKAIFLLWTRVISFNFILFKKCIELSHLINNR